MKRPAYSPDAPRKRSTPLSSPGFQGFHTDQLVHPLHGAGHRRNELLFPHVCSMAPVEGQTTKKRSHVTLEVTSSIWKNIIGSPYPEPDARSWRATWTISFILKRSAQMPLSNNLPPVSQTTQEPSPLLPQLLLQPCWPTATAVIVF